VKKTEQPEHNGILKGSSSVSSTEAYVGESGNSLLQVNPPADKQIPSWSLDS
jgi:hypothetical protein